MLDNVIENVFDFLYFLSIFESTRPGSKSTWFPGLLEYQKYKSTKVQKHKSTKAQKHKSTKSTKNNPDNSGP